MTTFNADGAPSVRRMDSTIDRPTLSIGYRATPAQFVSEVGYRILKPRSYGID